IMIALGGAAAEDLFYGGRSTGSRGDFDQAMAIVRNMAESGLTELGIVDASMITPESLTRVSGTILDGLMARTKNMLEEHRPVFDRSLAILMKEETLSGADFRDIMHKHEPIGA